MMIINMKALGPVTLTLFMFASDILQLAAVPASALHQQQIHDHGDYISHTSDTAAHNKQFNREEETHHWLRQTRSTQVSASFTLTTNNILSCSTGLTHAGVYLQVDYRLTSMLGGWISLINVTLDATSIASACQQQSETNLVLSTAVASDIIQFRIVQPEHGGGACNCWGVQNFTVLRSNANHDIPVDFSKPCNETALKNSSGVSCFEGAAYFCGGSAIVPRGAVSTLIDLNSNNIQDGDCVSGSEVVENKGSVPATTSDCGVSHPRIELKFILNLIPGVCHSAKRFDEGVVVAMGNWNNDGQWIPLRYYAPDPRISTQDISIGELNSGNVNFIRGYSVPYTIQSVSNSIEISLWICDQDLVRRDNVQFRWLQTTLFYGMKPKDTWTLDDVSIILHFNDSHSQILLEDDFNYQNMINSSHWNVGIRNGILSEDCGGVDPTDKALVFGTVCTTIGCGNSNTPIIASRLVSTTPLNISSLLGPLDVGTPPTEPSVVSSSSSLLGSQSTPVPILPQSASTLLPVIPSTSTLLPVAPSTSTLLPVAPSTSTLLPVAPSASTLLPVAPSTSTLLSVAPSTSTLLPVAPSTSTLLSVAPSTSTSVPVAPSTSTLLPVAPLTSTLLSVAPSTSTSVPVAPSTSTLLPVAPSTSTLLPVASSTSTLLPVAQSTSTLLPVAQSTSTLLPIAQSTSTSVPVASSTSTLLPVAQSTSTLLPVAQSTSTLLPVAQSTSTLPVIRIQSTSTLLPIAQSTSTSVPVILSTSTLLPVAHPTSTLLPVAPSTSTSVPVAPSTSTLLPVAPTTSTSVPVAPSTSTSVPVAPSTFTLLPVAPSTFTSVRVAPSTSTLLPVAPSTSTSVPVAPSTSTLLPVAPSTSTSVPVAPSTSTLLPVAPSTFTLLPVASSTSTSVPVAPSTSTSVPVAPSTSTSVPVAPSTFTSVPVAPSTSTLLSVAPLTSTSVPVAPSTFTSVPVAPSTSTLLPVAQSTSTLLPVAQSTSTLPVIRIQSTSTLLPIAQSTSTLLPVAPSTSTLLPVAQSTSTLLPVAQSTSTLPVIRIQSTSTLLPIAQSTSTSVPVILSTSITESDSTLSISNQVISKPSPTSTGLTTNRLLTSPPPIFTLVSIQSRQESSTQLTSVHSMPNQIITTHAISGQMTTMSSLSIIPTPSLSTQSTLPPSLSTQSTLTPSLSTPSSLSLSTQSTLPPSLSTPSSLSLSTQSTLPPSLYTSPTPTPSIFSSMVTDPVSSPTPTPNLDVVVLYEQQVQIDLMETLNRVLDSINNGTQNLSAIMSLPPIVAAQSLSGLVSAREDVDETVVAFLLNDILSKAENLDKDTEVKFVQSFVSIADKLIARTMMRSIEQEPSTIAGSTILTVMEQLAFDVLSDENTSITAPNIELAVSEVLYEEDDSDEDLVTGIDTRGHSIQLPRELLRLLNENFGGSGPFIIVSYLYRNISGLLPGTLPGRNDTQLASPVISSALQRNETILNTSDFELNTPVKITLTHHKDLVDLIRSDNESQVNCVYWKFISQSDGAGGLVGGRWSTDGCKKNDNLSDTTRTVCECTHLTNFAILLSVRPLPSDSVQALVLGIISYFGVSLSVIAMIITILALIFLRSLWSMRNFIHINLCISLILSQLTFVIGVTPHGGGVEVDPGCRTAAVLMQYFFLVSFMWMLMEGVVLYIALVKVFTKHHGRYMIAFTIASYGIPLIYMVICLPIGFALHGEPGYGYIQQANDTTGKPNIVCWLNPYTNFILTFIVPVVVIIVLNIGFFIMAIVIMCRHSKKQTHKTTRQSVKYWLRSSISLVTIMGLTWLTGILVFEVPALVPLAYIFTICAAFQGVAIFVIFILLSKQVRDAYSKWWKVKVAGSDVLSKHFGGWTLTYRNSTAVGLTLSGTSGKTSSTMDRTTSPFSPSALESSITKKEVFQMESVHEPANEEEEQKKRKECFNCQGTHFDVTYISMHTECSCGAVFEESTDSFMEHMKDGLDGVVVSNHTAETGDNESLESTSL